MKEKFLTYRRFKNAEAAKTLVEILKSNGIPYVVEDSSPSFDVTFSGSTLDNEVHIKIRQSDFESTEDLLLEETSVSTADISEDHYLHKFTDEELIEILIKPDEWSPTDYKLSQLILRERGRQIDAGFIKTLRKTRKDDLAKPERRQKAWVYAGYLMAFMGGIISVFIGWHLMSFKKTLPDGEQVYAYEKSDRNHGLAIFIIGIVFTVFWILLSLYN